MQVFSGERFTAHEWSTHPAQPHRKASEWSCRPQPPESGAASAQENPAFLWLPSQNGRLPDRPQRQRATARPSAGRQNSRLAWSVTRSRRPANWSPVGISTTSGPSRRQRIVMASGGRCRRGAGPAVPAGSPGSPLMAFAARRPPGLHPLPGPPPAPAPPPPRRSARPLGCRERCPPAGPAP